MLPGLTFPTSRAVQSIVQALFVYASTFTVFIVPFRGKVLEALSAAIVVIVIIIPVMAIATTVSLAYF